MVIVFDTDMTSGELETMKEPFILKLNMNKEFVAEIELGTSEKELFITIRDKHNRPMHNVTLPLE